MHGSHLMQQQQQQQAQSMKNEELNQHKLNQMFHQQKFNQMNPALMSKSLANPFMPGKETCIDSIKENSATFKP